MVSLLCLKIQARCCLVQSESQVFWRTLLGPHDEMPSSTPRTVCSVPYPLWSLFLTALQIPQKHHLQCKPYSAIILPVWATSQNSAWPTPTPLPPMASSKSLVSCHIHFGLNPPLSHSGTSLLALHLASSVPLP